MYIGVNEESGKKVREEDALDYAIKRCLTGDIDTRDEFFDILKNYDNVQNIGEIIVDWYYSGNWVKEVNVNE